MAATWIIEAAACGSTTKGKSAPLQWQRRAELHANHTTETTATNRANCRRSGWHEAYLKGMLSIRRRGIAQLSITTASTAMMV